MGTRPSLPLRPAGPLGRWATGPELPARSALPPPAQSTRPLGRDRAGFGPGCGTPPLPHPAPFRAGTLVLPSPRSPTLGGTFSVCFRGISSFSTVVSDPKSLRSFPGIVQQKLRRATCLFTAWRKRDRPRPSATPAFVTSCSGALPAEA